MFPSTFAGVVVISREDGFGLIRADSRAQKCFETWARSNEAAYWRWAAVVEMVVEGRVLEVVVRDEEEVFQRRLL